jgi:tRNA threonylcarbamoyladenosine biosynthesis protein TsaB
MSLVLALHSSSDVFGVGVAPLNGQVAGDGLVAGQSQAFPLGRSLSNQLFTAVEAVLPANQWPHIARLAVALGPGGFTGTRLTVVMARILAEQLGVPLDGVGSFLLIARRLQLREPTWLVQTLPRRGVVAGCYGPSAQVSNPAAWGGMEELAAPKLYASVSDVPAGPQQAAIPELPADVDQLLHLACLAAAAGVEAPWQPVLPLYPTSPVGEA